MDVHASARSVLVSNKQTMGFSGATVADVLADGQRLFLKVVEPDPLPPTATAADPWPLKSFKIL